MNTQTVLARSDRVYYSDTSHVSHLVCGYAWHVYESMPCSGCKVGNVITTSASAGEPDPANERAPPTPSAA